MHAKTTVITLTALALLAGCNRGAANNSVAASANSATANATAPAVPTAAPAPAPVAGAPVDTALLTSHPWAPVGECEEALTFNPDGTATGDGEAGAWSLAGNDLTVTKEGSPPQTFTVSRSGENIVMAQGGQSITISACPAG